MPCDSTSTVEGQQVKQCALMKHYTFLLLIEMLPAQMSLAIYSTWNWCMMILDTKIVFQAVIKKKHLKFNHFAMVFFKLAMPLRRYYFYNFYKIIFCDLMNDVTNDVTNGIKILISTAALLKPSEN